MTDPLSPPHLVCDACGTGNQPIPPKCASCHAPLVPAPRLSPGAAAIRASDRPSPLLVVVVAVLAIAMGSVDCS